jgi:hypothetical protein
VIKITELNYVEYKVHTYNRNGLCALGFMDDHYPVRSAFSLLNQVIILVFVAWIFSYVSFEMQL